jgi:hypothetical protein
MPKDIVPVENMSDADVFTVRGERVMLDSRIAEAFGTQTKRVNEVVARNPEKFGPAHAFQLTEAEHAQLRSHTATSKPGRGGTRYAPHVFTLKGAARLATVLDTPAALRATDLIIDTFLAVQHQVKSGRKTVAIPEPERYRPTQEHREQYAKMRVKLANALSKLLDTVIDAENQRTLRQASQSLGSSGLQHLHERLRSKALENTKLEADTTLVLAQAEKALAEARKTSAEADGVDISNLEKRIAAVHKFAELMTDLAPHELVELIDEFDTELKPRALLPKRTD